MNSSKEALHCPACGGLNWPNCPKCAPTAYNPPQKCWRCGSEMHASCALGDHDTPADFELEAALKALNDTANEATLKLAELHDVKVERDCYLAALVRVSMLAGEGVTRPLQYAEIANTIIERFRRST